MNYKQPFFTLKISSVHCGYRLAVNGFPIDDNLTGEPVTIEHPINAWIKTGHNSFEVHHLHINSGTGKKGNHPNGSFTLELRVKEFGDETSKLLSKTNYNAERLSRLQNSNAVDFDDIIALKKSISASSVDGDFDVSETHEVTIEEGTFAVLPYEMSKGPHKSLSIAHNVELETPFPLWKMFEADDLVTRSEMTKETWNEARITIADEAYQPVWTALLNKDTKALESIFEQRCSEYDIAYYTKQGQNRYELIVHLLSFVDGENWTPLEMHGLKFDILVTYNKKGTHLHTPHKPLMSAFKFIDDEAGLETRIPMMWAQFDGKWEIVR